MENGNWELFLEECERLGMALYNGETAGGIQSNGSPASNFKNASEEAGEYRANYLDSLIESGVQLSHWWTFHSDRATQNNDLDSFTVCVDGPTAATFEAVKAANEKLQATYKVNPISAENTDKFGEMDPALLEQNPVKLFDNGEILWVIIAIAGAVVVIAGVATVVIIKKKKK